VIRLRAIRSPAASVKKITKNQKKCTAGSRPAAGKNQKNLISYSTVVDDLLDKNHFINMYPASLISASYHGSIDNYLLQKRI
jgi:hypothetical protein